MNFFYNKDVYLSLGVFNLISDFIQASFKLEILVRGRVNFNPFSMNGNISKTRRHNFPFLEILFFLYSATYLLEDSLKVLPPRIKMYILTIF